MLVRPTNTVLAHDLLDLHDRAWNWREQLDAPDSIERWIPEAKEVRDQLASAVVDYERRIERLLATLGFRAEDGTLEALLRYRRETS